MKMAMELKCCHLERGKMNNYWHPMNLPKGEGFISVESAMGVVLTDQKGRNYIDGYSGLWNVNLGHNLPEISHAIIKQLGKLAYANPIVVTFDLIEQLSAKLIELTGGKMEKVIYTCSGSESNEVAIKIARKFAFLSGDKRRKIAVFGQSYHGSYYGSLSISSFEHEFKSGYGPFLTDIINLPSPCFEKISPTILKRMLEDLSQECNAIFIEPVLGSAGIWPLPREHAEVIQEFCDTHNVMLIVDEVATGFGRTGSWFYFQQLGLNPDLICLSKGINNGMLPMGAVCVSKAISNEFERKNEILFHLSTQNGNPLAVASAMATISWMIDNDILTKVKNLSNIFFEQLTEKIKDLKSIKNIRQVGLMIGIDIINPTNGYPLSYEEIKQLVSKIIRAGLLCGCSYIPDKHASIILMPPFILKRSQVNKLMNILVSSLS